MGIFHRVTETQGEEMRKIDRKLTLKILLLILKVLLAVPLTVLFILIRCIQHFLKICGTVVSFVCIVAAVVLSIGTMAEIILQAQGEGPGVGVILFTLCIAGGLAYVPAAGVSMVMLVLEAACSWIWKFYMGSSRNWKVLYKRPDYQWSAFEGGYKGKDTDDSEFSIHYFKGVKNQEELKKRYTSLMRIYRPDNVFGEDEITRSIMEEYDYLKNRFAREEGEMEEKIETEKKEETWE